MVVDWKVFESKFVKVVDGEKKSLVLTGWRTKSKAFAAGDVPKPSLEFDVLSEDGVLCDPPKIFEVTNPGLVAKLKPLILAAETSGAAAVGVTLVRVGIGSNTRYSVTENH